MQKTLERAAREYAAMLYAETEEKIGMIDIDILRIMLHHMKVAGAQDMDDAQVKQRFIWEIQQETVVSEMRLALGDMIEAEAVEDENLAASHAASYAASIFTNHEVVGTKLMSELLQRMRVDVAGMDDTELKKAFTEKANPLAATDAAQPKPEVVSSVGAIIFEGRVVTEQKGASAANLNDAELDSLVEAQAAAAANAFSSELTSISVKRTLQEMGFITEGQSDEQLLNTYLREVIGSDLDKPSNSKGIGPKFVYDSTIS